MSPFPKSVEHIKSVNRNEDGRNMGFVWRRYFGGSSYSKRIPKVLRRKGDMKKVTK
jgi:hypothetical protein